MPFELYFTIPIAFFVGTISVICQFFFHQFGGFELWKILVASVIVIGVLWRWTTYESNMRELHAEIDGEIPLQSE
jgi:uncharacterized membrane protein YhhN